MKADRIVHIVAGSLVLISLFLGAPASPMYYSSYFLWLTAFVGANLFQSGFTQFCLMQIILLKTGICSQ